jgi:homoserine O-acetyltransferase
MRAHIAAALAACLTTAAGLALSEPALAQPTPPVVTKLAVTEGDYVIHGFKFGSGESLPELRMHYRTLGQPRRDAKGHVTNAVLIMHGTGGDSSQFVTRPQFADVLLVPGGLLDPARYFIILPDDIGHGKSSKPSDGLRAHFPHYDYDDMVRAEHELVTKGLGVDHLRLVMGTSMGCMHSFVWGEMYPDAMDALMPLACLPDQIAGRNRIWRDMVATAITKDPAWKGGDYTEEPHEGMRTADYLLSLAGSAPLLWQKLYPTREAANDYVENWVEKGIGGLDANDLLYQVESSRNYDPSPNLEKITAPMVWINSADDFINPPELGIAEREAKRLKHGRFILIPIGPTTHGHSTHTWAVNWKQHLEALLKESEHPAR